MKRTLRAIATVLVTAASLFAQNQCPPDSLLAAADNAYEAYENAQALETYREAYRRCPDSYEALMKLTRAYNDVAEEVQEDNAEDIFRVALRHADTLRQKYPDSMMGYFLSAAVAGNLARTSGGEQKVRLSRVVEKNARKAIELDSTYSPSYVILGSYYREVATTGGWLKTIARLLYGELPDGSLEDSRRVLEKALELDPENPYAHLAMAETLLEMDKDPSARDHLQTVLELPVTSHYDPVLKREARELLQG